MTDSFFGFDDTSPNDVFDENTVSDEEDEDFDALNNETFGDDTWGGDWEEDHEKLAELAELSRHGFNDDNGDLLSDQIAALILEDDQVEKKPNNHIVKTPIENTRPKPRPPPGFITNETFTNETCLPDPSQPPNLLNFKNVCTVEELERRLIKPPPTSLRLEDLERKLISSANEHQVPVRVPIIPLSLAGQLGRHIGAPQPHVKLPFPQMQFQHPVNPQAILMRGNIPRPNIWLQGGMMQTPVDHASVQHPEDPYAGLMSQSEKLWVGGIQLMQLNTNQRFQDDYYYIMFTHRQSGGRKVNPLKPIKDLPVNKTYTPVQYENSLGKLQAGSVTAPRKIIDTEIVEKTPVESPSTVSSTKKVKQLLLEIEQLYIDVLKAEEALSPLVVHHPEGDINPNQLFTNTVNTLMKNNKLKNFFSIRKGKALVLRVMSHPEISNPLAYKLLYLLPGVSQRDTDQSLLRALPCVRQYIMSTSKEVLLKLAVHLQSHISFLLHDKFGVSVLANLLERGESLNLEEEEWSAFIGSLEPPKDSPWELERPVVGIPSPVLTKLFSKAQPPLSELNTVLLTRTLATLNSFN